MDYSVIQIPTVFPKMQLTLNVQPFVTNHNALYTFNVFKTAKKHCVCEVFFYIGYLSSLANLLHIVNWNISTLFSISGNCCISRVECSLFICIFMFNNYLCSAIYQTKCPCSIITIQRQIFSQEMKWWIIELYKCNIYFY